MTKLWRTWLIVLSFTQLSVNGQNVVPNPSFEEVNKLPCVFTSPGESISDYVKSWRMPTGGTSDIWFLDSLTNTTCGQNLARYKEKPHTGKYCAGILVSTINAVGSRNPYREYLQVELTKPLEIGKVYYTEWYALLRGSSRYAANNLGAYVSAGPISLIETTTNFGGILAYKPQVNETKILSEPEKWVKISGCFVAKEPYRYLTIGNFFDDEHTLFTSLTEEQARLGSYYLIDDVLVREAGTSFLPSANLLGPDTTLCYNQSLTITLPNQPGVVYQGPQTSGTNSFTINQSGLYSVTATAGQCVVRDTLQVTVEPPVVLPPDTTLCQGEVLTLAPKPSNRHYNWSDGSTDSTLTVTQAGQYWVRVPSRYCNISDTIRVSYLDCPGEVPNVFTPNGDGKNDAFVIPNIQLLSWRLEIFNRWGRRVYDAEPYHNDWKGEGLPSGLYYYYLSDRKLKRHLKGWVQIIR